MSTNQKCPKSAGPIIKTLSRSRMSMQEKLNLIEEGEAGATTSTLCEKYGLALRSVQRLLQNKDQIRKSVRELFKLCPANRRKCTIGAKNDLLDKAVYLWYEQQRYLSEPMTNMVIRTMSQVFNKKLEANLEFRASNGWLSKFKTRNKIRLAEQHTGHIDTENFPEKYLEALSGVHPDNLYYVDETGKKLVPYLCLNWKALPIKFLARCDGEIVNDVENVKDRTTLLCCANASRRHALPLLVIGAPTVPRHRRKKSDLPFQYIVQPKGWINALIFRHWYGTTFVPQVRERQRKDGILGEVVLLLNEAPCHPGSSILNDIEDNFRVLYMPPNCSKISQPKDQLAIDMLKRLYRRALLVKILSVKAVDLLSFQHNLTMDIVCRLASRAWAELYSKTPTEHSCLLEEILGLLQRLNPGVTKEEADEWLESDRDDVGYTIMSEDDVVAAVRQDWGDDDEEEVDELDNAVIEERPVGGTFVWFNGEAPDMEEEEQEVPQELPTDALAGYESPVSQEAGGEVKEEVWTAMEGVEDVGGAETEERTGMGSDNEVPSKEAAIAGMEAALVWLATKSSRQAVELQRKLLPLMMEMKSVPDQ